MLELLKELAKYKIMRKISRPGSFEQMAAFEFECKTEREIRRRIKDKVKGRR